MAKTAVQIAELTQEEKSNFQKKYDTFIFDFDGTLVDMHLQPIPGAKNTISSLSELGKNIYVFTDKGAFTKNDLGERIQEMFPEIKKENIVSTQWLLAKYLKENKEEKKVYAMGHRNGLIKELQDIGLDVIFDEEIPSREMVFQDVLNFQPEPGVGAVVVGVDFNFTYMKLLAAFHYLSNEECDLFVTHKDMLASVDPPIPVSGAIAKPMELYAGKKAFSCGKSSPSSVEFLKSLGHEMDKCLFIGDWIETDIRCGNLAGMDTLYVLSGIGKAEEVNAATEDGDTQRTPNYIAESVLDLGSLYVPLE